MYHKSPRREVSQIFTTVVPCNSELLLTSFADNVFLGTYYEKYLFRRDDLFFLLQWLPYTLFIVCCDYLLIPMNIGSSHGIILTFIKHLLCITGIVPGAHMVLTHLIFTTTSLNKHGSYDYIMTKETEEHMS